MVKLKKTISTREKRFVDKLMKNKKEKKVVANMGRIVHVNRGG